MIDIGKVEKKINRGASFLWFGAIFVGLVIVVVGLLWFLDLQGFIEIDIMTICSVLIVLAGAGVIGFALWLRSMIGF